MPRHATETLVPPIQRQGDGTDLPGRSPDPSGAASGPPDTGRTGRRDMTDHWGPLEGWTRERGLLACYLTFAGQSGLHSVIQAHQRSIKDLDGLDCVPVEWLHSTVQGIAFADSLPSGSADVLAAALTPKLARMPAVAMRTGAPVLGDGGTYLQLGPAQALAAVRDVIRETAGTELGLDQPYALPGQSIRYDPHVSFAYANTTVPAGQAWDRLCTVRHEPVDLDLTTVSMVLLRRDDVARRWHWSSARPLHLAGR